MEAEGAEAGAGVRCDGCSCVDAAGTKVEAGVWVWVGAEEGREIAEAGSGVAGAPAEAKAVEEEEEVGAGSALLTPTAEAARS
jgi:hypothetical protein